MTNIEQAEQEIRRLEQELSAFKQEAKNMKKKEKEAEKVPFENTTLGVTTLKIIRSVSLPFANMYKFAQERLQKAKPCTGSYLKQVSRLDKVILQDDMLLVLPRKQQHRYIERLLRELKKTEDLIPDMINESGENAQLLADEFFNFKKDIHFHLALVRKPTEEGQKILDQLKQVEVPNGN